MARTIWLLLLSLVVFLNGCGPTTTIQEARKAPEPEGAYRIYVTNEASGDLSVIDPARHEVIATVKLGKRPRGIHASPDRKTIYVALSGSPMAPPGVDERTLPPPDRSADGIGVFDVETSKLVRVIPGGSDPEEFDLSKDGNLIYVSNEDAAKASIIDIAAGKIVQEFPVGEEPEGVTTSPDGKFVYVTSEDTGAIFVIDTVAAKVVKNFKVGLRPRDVAFLPNGSKAYVIRENDG
jgi:YVTN family beta-propeller protein